MTLNDVWFVLFILIIAGYLILDGFDMGVGILLLPLARTDIERRTFLNSIGPVWDGNEVWLVLGVGVLFAVFPLAYASLFSGMYIAFMLVLLVLILRTVALEFRSQGAGHALAFDLGRGLRARVGWVWRCCWASAFGEHRVRAAGRRHGQLLVRPDRIAHAVPLLVGVTTVAMFAMQGGIYLMLKTEGELHDRVERRVPRLMIAFFALNTLVVDRDGAILRQNMTDRYLEDIWPVIFPAAALAALGGAWLFVRRGEAFKAFLSSSATIGLLLVSGGIGLYPNLLVSTLGPGLQPDHLQRRVGRQHARGGAGQAVGRVQRRNEEVRIEPDAARDQEQTDRRRRAQERLECLAASNEQPCPAQRGERGRREDDRPDIRDVALRDALAEEHHRDHDEGVEREEGDHQTRDRTGDPVVQLALGLEHQVDATLDGEHRGGRHADQQCERREQPGQAGREVPVGIDRQPRHHAPERDPEHQRQTQRGKPEDPVPGRTPAR